MPALPKKQEERKKESNEAAHNTSSPSLLGVGGGVTSTKASTVGSWLMYISLASIPDVGQGTECGFMSFVCASSVSLRGGGILNVASVAGVCPNVNLDLAMVLIVRYDIIAHDGWGVG
jgi:hypothetical protein